MNFNKYIKIHYHTVMKIWWVWSHHIGYHGKNFIHKIIWSNTKNPHFYCKHFNVSHNAINWLIWFQLKYHWDMSHTSSVNSSLKLGVDNIQCGFYLKKSVAYHLLVSLVTKFFLRYAFRNLSMCVFAYFYYFSNKFEKINLKGWWEFWNVLFE